MSTYTFLWLPVSAPFRPRWLLFRLLFGLDDLCFGSFSASAPFRPRWPVSAPFRPRWPLFRLHFGLDSLCFGSFSASMASVSATFRPRWPLFRLLFGLDGLPHRAFRAANYPSSLSQSERHNQSINQYIARVKQNIHALGTRPGFRAVIILHIFTISLTG